MPAPKNFRLDDELRATFEKVCGENLFDERSVVEAWLLQFVEATTEQRQAVAKHYANWLSQRATKARGQAARKTRKKLT